MVFSSHLFVFWFLPAALLLYFGALALSRRLPGNRWLPHLTLTLLSYAFYGWANPAFVLLMLFSTVVDYVCGLVIGRDPPGARTRRQRVAVTVSVVTNLGLLGFFKYFNFGLDSWNVLAAGAGFPVWDTVLRVTLPLGISFYTFQSMSYTLDVYRGRTGPLRSFLDFACYVSLFPQLVAGPILRFHELADQLRHRTHSLEKASRGAAFFCLGMAKKVLLANPCGKVADLAFEAGSLGPLDAWYGAVAYAFQIYFDFSGYTDMAIGLGLALGFVFPKNFDSPYLSASITEFWRRWHISLSSWLRDYLYVPLGGNRKGPVRTYVNLFLVMLLGGLWHGAAWTFVVWGAYHGVLLAVERWRGKRSLAPGLPPVGRRVVTFLLVTVGWVFFRAESLPHALRYLGSMVGLTPVRPEAALLSAVTGAPYYLGTFLVAALVTWGAPQTWDWTRRLTPVRAGAALGAFALALAAMEAQGYNPFIYFIF
jgi:alginate O-acetyltransferase complex protein AlgI